MKTIDVKDSQKAFFEYIKVAREREGMSQTDVAEKMGVSQSYLSRLESGERMLDFAFAFELCTVLGLDMEDFIKEYKSKC